MQITKDKLLTAEQRANAMYWAHLLNNELMIIDYLIFNKLQYLTNELIDEAKKCGIYKQKDKMLLNQIKDECDKLVIACQTSELLEMMDNVVCFFPNYRFDYMKEGGYFMQQLVWEWKKVTDNHFYLLHNAIKMVFGKYSQYIKNIEFSSKLYLCFITCQVLDCFTELCREKLKKITGVDHKQMSMKRYVSLRGKLLQLTDKYITNEDMFTQHDHFMIQNGGQAIVNLTMNDVCGNIITETFKGAIKDYANYCVARMLLDVRSKGNIKDADRMRMKRVGFVDEFIDEIVNELKKTHVGEKEDDVMELKDMVYRIKYRKHLNVFYKVMEYGNKDKVGVKGQAKTA